MNQQKLEIEQKTAELEDGMKQRQLEIEALTKKTMKQQLEIQELRQQVAWLSWAPWPWEDQDSHGKPSTGR